MGNVVEEPQKVDKEITEDNKKQMLIEAVRQRIDISKQEIEEHKAVLVDLEDINGAISLYIGKEILKVDTSIYVNLHKIKSKTILQMPVEKYKQGLEAEIAQRKVTIEALKNSINEFSKQLEGLENGEIILDGPTEVGDRDSKESS